MVMGSWFTFVWFLLFITQAVKRTRTGEFRFGFIARGILGMTKG